MNAAMPSSSNRLVGWVAVGAAAILLGLQLLVPPIVGLANNGDFERVMGYAGFNYLTDKYEEKYFGHIVTKFAIVSMGWYKSGHWTSETPLAVLARFVSAAALPGRFFDIRFLGAIHMLLLLAAIGIFVRSCRDLAPATQWVVAGLLVLVFTDVGYAAAFNSFYPQTASLLFLLLTVAIAAVGLRRGELDGGLLVLYFLCAALYVCSKPQEAIQGPLLAAMGLCLAGVRRQRWWRKPAIWLALGLCVVSFWYYRETPRDHRYVARFDNMFLEILPHSPNPAKDLEELGLDRDMLQYSGMDAYRPNAPIWDPAFQKRFFDRFGYRALVQFYLRHPERLLDRLRRGAPAAFNMRPGYLGNFERSTGVAPQTRTAHFALWSGMRTRPGSRAVLWLVGFFGANLAAVSGSYRHASARGRLYLSALTFLIAMAGAEFLVCAFADCLVDLGRHLYLFDGLCDLVLVADIAWLAQIAVSRRRSREPAVAASNA